MPSATRRTFVRTTAAGAALPLAAAKTASTAGVYSRLGVKPIINGMGTVTVLGGSLMPPEVVQAMEDAGKHFVSLPELQTKVGERIAALLEAPAAMVTAGAASAITVATAACMTRGDRKRYAQLPDASTMPHEVIQQKRHRHGYEAQIRVAGARIIEVETREELERAIHPKTAMLFFLNKADGEGQIRRAEFIEIGRKHQVPTFNDAAADVPPASRLKTIVQEGFDLVAFSGGKGLLGPQCSGVLLGRKDLIEAAQPAISPAGGIGRGMKVGKEEMIGLLAAIERYLKVDHEAELRILETRVAHIVKALGTVVAVKAEREVPKIANEVPHVAVTWNESERGMTTAKVLEKLREGDPPIALLGRGPGRILVSVWMMRGNEHAIVARRLREVFSNA